MSLIFTIIFKSNLFKVPDIISLCSYHWTTKNMLKLFCINIKKTFLNDSFMQNNCELTLTNTLFIMFPGILQLETIRKLEWKSISFTHNDSELNMFGFTFQIFLIINQLISYNWIWINHIGLPKFASFIPNFPNIRGIKTLQKIIFGTSLDKALCIVVIAMECSPFLCLRWFNYNFRNRSIRVLNLILTIFIAEKFSCRFIIFYKH